MKITDSSILMGSQRTYTEKFEEHTDLRIWINPDRSPDRDRVSISQDARACTGCGSKGLEDGSAKDIELEVSLERLITEILSGRKVRIVRTEDLERDAHVSGESARAEDPGQSGEGWGIDYSHETVYEEQETVSFDASGIIRTSDGEELKFSLRLEMSREFVERNSLRIRAGDALRDPLVINFDGTAVQLKDRTFGFDIDADGLDESLPRLSAGKGYLAIDLDNDGAIDNGAELFGPSTGNGFRELSAYDDDGNGWIDESDAAFSRLSVLTFNGDGQQVLQGIGGLGVGALYTSSTQTRFDMKDQQSGEILARIRSSGVFIAENGTIGTIQQIDLKV